MSRIIRCSQCGQEGHNRRNRNCPVNFNRTSVAQPVQTITTQHTMTPEARARVTLINSRLSDAMNELDRLTRFISRQNRSGYTIGVFVTTMLFCEKINLALDIDNGATQLIEHVSIFEQLSELIGIFNNTFALIRRRTIINVSLRNRRFYATMGSPPTAVPLKRTSDYLKEVALIQDTPVTDNACECPLCFDSFASAELIVTNCNHSFCGICIKGFADSIKDKTKKPNCPMCRADLTEFKIGNQQVYNEISEHILNL